MLHFLFEVTGITTRRKQWQDEILESGVSIRRQRGNVTPVLGIIHREQEMQIFLYPDSAP